MKNFAYTVRDSGGALRRGTLDAPDRASALAALRRQDLTPVALEEGGASARGRAVPPRAGAAWAALALAVLAVGGGLWLALSRRSAPAAPVVPVAPAAPATPAVPAVPVAPVVTAEPAGTVGTAVGNAGTAETPASERPAPAAGVGLSARKKPMRVIEAIPGMSTNPPPQTGFSSNTERVLNMIMNAKRGMPPPPLIPLPPGEDLAKVLERDIGVLDEDDEQTIAEKANVAYAKKLLKEYLEQGGDPDAFLEHYHGALKKDFEERQSAQKFMMELLWAGDKKGVEEYMTRKNAELEERGIVPLKIPPFMR